MTCVRLVLVATLAFLWIIRTHAVADEESMQITPKYPSDNDVQKREFNTTTTELDKRWDSKEEVARKRLLRRQRQKMRRRRRRQMKLERRRRRKLRKLARKNGGVDNEIMRKQKNQMRNNQRNGRKKKNKKRHNKRRNNKKKKNKKKSRKRKTSKDRKRKRKHKKKQRKNKRRKNRRRGPSITCKNDNDCAKAGPEYCCQYMKGRCVKPGGGRKCFGSCMCNARQKTKNFLCVTKKKKFNNFQMLKKLGKVTQEMPRGHCRNITLNELQNPSHKYQQIV